MDAGDFTGEDSEPGRLQTEALIEGMNALEYRVANLGSRELLHGWDAFAARRSKAQFGFVSANVVWQDTGEPVVEPARVETVALGAGKKARAIRIGFIGLARYDPAFHARGPDGRAIVTVDAAAAAAKHLPALRGKSDIVVVLSSLDLEEAKRLPKAVGGIDLVLGGRGARQTRPDDFPEDTRFGKTSLFYITDQGKDLGEVRLFLDGGGTIASTKRSAVYLTAQWPDEPVLASLMERTRRAVNDWNRARAEGQSPFAAPGLAPAAVAAGYTGSDRCADCHAGEYRSWAASGHAHAFETLVEAEQDFNPRCVGCHTIGFGTANGFVNAKATPGLVNVGCESCHGPSSQHPDTVAKGYGKTDTAACRTCHTPENSPDYDPITYIPRVRHWPERQAAR